jgi:polyhydroxybutyrate depolymerase
VTKRRKYLRKLLALLLLGAGLSVGIMLHQIYRSDGVVLTGGKKRGYLLHVPKSYQPGKPTPLVISFHGFSEWPAHLMKISGWNAVADEFGFLVVYPRGTGFPLRWFCNGQPGDDRKGAQDVQFISDLLDQLGRNYSIDTNRVYANGLSNGGGMSCLLACKLSDRIAAVGSVSGAYLLPRSEWTTARRVPIILFHGTDDPLVPFHGGPSRAFPVPFPDVPSWAQWLGTNYGCAPEPAKLPDSGHATGVRYGGGTNETEVVFYTLSGGGHTWPGGGKLPAILAGHTPSDINATRLMWEFFQKHSIKR